MTIKFELNRKGGEEVLKQLAADGIHALTQKVAENAGDVVWVHESTTDRARGSVTVPAGLQAKHGALTKAAAAAGLEIKPPK